MKLFSNLFGHSYGFDCGAYGCTQKQSAMRQQPFNMADLIEAQKASNQSSSPFSGLRAMAMTPAYIAPNPSSFDNFTYRPSSYRRWLEHRADVALNRYRKAFDDEGWNRPDSWRVLLERYYMNRALKLFIPDVLAWINRPTTMFQRIQMDRIESGAKRIVLNKGRNIR